MSCQKRLAKVLQQQAVVLIASLCACASLKLAHAASSDSSSSSSSSSVRYSQLATSNDDATPPQYQPLDLADNGQNFVASNNINARNKFINGNHAVYVEPPANFKPIIYASLEATSAVPEYDSLQPEAQSLSPSSSVSSSFLDDNSIVDSPTQAGHKSPHYATTGNRWSEWRDISGVEPELATSESQQFKRLAAPSDQLVADASEQNSIVAPRHVLNIWPNTRRRSMSSQNKSRSLRNRQTPATSSGDDLAQQAKRQQQQQRPRFLIRRLSSARRPAEPSATLSKAASAQELVSRKLAKLQTRQVRGQGQAQHLIRTRQVKHQNKRRPLRTLLPVGLSSWFLGGMRDLDGLHWHMPSELRKQLAINDMDFVRNNKQEPRASSNEIGAKSAEELTTSELFVAQQQSTPIPR